MHFFRFTAANQPRSCSAKPTTTSILRLRLLMARRRLRTTTDAVGRIAAGCGFYDQAHFTRAFKKHTGETPLEFRRRGL